MLRHELQAAPHLMPMNAFSGTTEDASQLNLWRGWKKLGDPARRSPTELFVLLDEHPDSINDAYYIATLQGYGGAYAWCDIPATFHNVDWVKGRQGDLR